MIVLKSVRPYGEGDPVDVLVREDVWRIAERRIEAALAAQGRRPEDSDLAEMDRLWDAAKAAEKAAE